MGLVEHELGLAYQLHTSVHGSAMPATAVADCHTRFSS